MNWFNLIIAGLLATGGFIATTYELLAAKMALPVGHSFQRHKPMTIAGNFIAYAAITLSAFMNPWWTIFIVFLTGWFASRMIIRISGSRAQILSVVFIAAGAVLLFS